MVTKKRKATTPKSKKRGAVKRQKVKVIRRTVKTAKVARVKAPVRPHLKPRKKAKAAPKMLENAHVRGLLLDLAGEKALKIVGELTEPMSDEDVSKHAGVKISEIRAVLNKLHAAGIAVYDRTRNDEGWYTYTWRLAADKALEIIEDKRAEEKRSAKERLCLESTTDYYMCPSCFARTNTRLSFEQAVEAGFRCPDCSEMLRYAEKKG